MTTLQTKQFNKRLALSACLILASASYATDNSWVNTKGGFWETASYWSAGEPGSAFDRLFITNAVTKTVALFSPLPLSTLTVSNLTVSGSAGTVNTLSVGAVSEGPLCILNGLSVGIGGQLQVTGTATLRVDSVSGGAFDVDGSVTLGDGLLVTANGTVNVGAYRDGTLTLNGGTWLAKWVNVGNYNGSRGRLTLAGGTNQTDYLYVGMNAAATGAVLVTDGQLIVGNSVIGSSGFGQATVSNGLFQSDSLVVGQSPGSRGSLAIAGGNIFAVSTLTIGAQTNSAGSLLMTGGKLSTYIPEKTAYVGSNGVGQVEIRGGEWDTSNEFLGYSPGAQGTLTIAGGINSVNGHFYAGCQGTGLVYVTDGALNVKNGYFILGRDAAAFGQLTVSNGLCVSELGTTLGENAGAYGSLMVAGGSGDFRNALILGQAAGSTGVVVQTGGELHMYSYGTVFKIGDAGVGQMTHAGGICESRLVTVGNQDGAQGSLVVAGGTNSVYGSFTVGNASNSFGTVVITSGKMDVVGPSVFGKSGTGSLIVSNGVWHAENVNFGESRGSSGSLSVSGGSVVLAGPDLICNIGGQGYAQAWLTGGELDVSAGSLYLGGVGTTTGAMTVAGGICRAGKLYVAPYGPGALNIDTGHVLVQQSFYLGSGAGTGTICLAEGELIATNNYRSYIGEFGNGHMIVSNGDFRVSYLDVGVVGRGTLTLEGGQTTVSGELRIGANGLGYGSLLLDGAQLVTPDSSGYPTLIGYNLGHGQVTVSNGTWVAGNVQVGSYSGQGELTLAGGTNSFDRLTVGFGRSDPLYGQSNGVVSVVAGRLDVRTGVTIGNGGIGHVTVGQDVSWSSGRIVVGSLGGVGTLVLDGATTVQSNGISIAYGGTGTVWVTGGSLTSTDQPTVIGAYSQGLAQMTVDHARWQAGSVSVGSVDGTSGLFGALDLVGDATCTCSDLTIGNASCTTTGEVTICDSSLYVTNAARNAKLEVRCGTFKLCSGLVRVDRFVMTSPGARFIRTGGTLQAGTVILAPAGDADGDGLSNSWEQSNGLDPLDPGDASGDNDGDGQKNLDEYLAGTSPTNSASAFRITAIRADGAGIQVTWTTVGGKSYVMQTNSLQAGSLFADFSPVISVPGTGEITTNYVHSGATPPGAWFYRVRLGP